ncbi:putative blue-light photoreceptor PCMADA3 [Mycotypha africana]|uniref:putative blue-light photoreceptor PCMADA3 n=1 Tax=Mycotypha africana TaxID=64632 RepID=UPI00230122C6|nr:putative blue-light photoreceptor PCMADA3 [Mycotypha africana]KAI8973230.1 putative blue-light photoreceptor PCMADA3 [Mycotypha africana]
MKGHKQQQQGQDTAALTGVYSSTGFDMINILVRLTQRSNPQIQLGPVDLSCSFVVSDANAFDQPVVYSSPAFERLTGYTNSEIVGRNCRFLQSPDGQVTCGSRRQHTDNEAVFYVKSQLNQGKEHQASIINYRKGGHPFVNLITIVPLLDAFGKIEYYVGLQVDLVEQPNAILERMQNGTYVMNYSLPVHFADYPSPSRVLDTYFQELPTGKISIGSSNNSLLIQQQHVPSSINLLPHTSTATTAEMDADTVQKEWNHLLLEESCDLIHVISLKGTFLYVSNASYSLLEYEPAELLNQSLSTICHPSDIVPVMREIKESTAYPDRNISLLFRVRRKFSGFIWMECFGQVHMDQSRSRKCLILSGRQISVYALAKKALMLQQPTTHKKKEEFWAKLSVAGLYLYVTKGCEKVVGYSPSSLEQESVFQYVDTSEIVDVRKALEWIQYDTMAGREQEAVRLSHTFLNAKGNYVPVTSTFCRGDALSNNSTDVEGRLQASFILMHVQLQDSTAGNGGMTTNNEISTTKLAMIAYPTNNAKHENFFAELETTRGTSWQYELHKLQSLNERLRDKISNYNKPNTRTCQRKRVNVFKLRICANCQTTESPEWRKGPRGPKELCNACGIRYSKFLSQK